MPATVTASKLKVFISYSRRDAAFVDRLQAALRERGIDAAVDRTEIEKGEEWWGRIRQLISEADSIVFALSPDSVASSVCRAEVDAAEALNKRFIPIVVRDVENLDVPDALRRLNYIFAVEPTGFEIAVMELVSALETDLVWVREHTRLGTIAHRWDTTGRLSDLVLRGAELAAAETWLTSRPRNAPTPTDLHNALIMESRRSATRRQRMTVAVSLVALVAAMGLAGLAVWQRGLAMENADRAQHQESIARQNERKAVETAERALLSQSKYLAGFAEQAADSGDAVTAALLSLEALPDADRSRPYFAGAESSLYRAILQIKETHVLAGHEGLVMEVALSPDGTRAVSASNDKTLRVWDLRSGELVAVLRGHTGEVLTVAFTPDGEVISGAWDGTVRKWTVGDGTSKVLHDLDRRVDRVRVARDGRSIVVAAGDAFLYSLVTGELIARIAHKGIAEYDDVAVLPDNSGVLAASPLAPMGVWEVSTGQRVLTMPEQRHEPGTVALFADGTRIATGARDNSVKIWSLRTGEVLSIFTGHTDEVNAVDVAGDGSFVVSGSKDGTIRVWDVSTGRNTATLSGHAGEVRSVSLSPDGRFLVSGSSDGTARVWTLAGGQPQLRIAHTDRVQALKAMPTGASLISGTRDGQVRSIDAETGASAVLLSGADSVHALAISADGNRVAIGDGSDRLRVYDFARRSLVLDVASGHGGVVSGVAFLPGERLVSTGGPDFGDDGYSIRLWSVDRSRPIANLPMAKGAVSALATSADAARVLTTRSAIMDYIYSIRSVVPDLSTADEIATEHTSPINALAVSPDGARAVTASSDHTLGVVDLASGRVIATLAGHADAVHALAISADGRRVVSGSHDKTTRIWDLVSAEQIGIIRGHESQINAVAVTADGRQIASGGDDNSVQIWPLWSDTAELVAEAKSRVARCLSPEERKRFHLEPSPPAWCREKWPYHTRGAQPR